MVGRATAGAAALIGAAAVHALPAAAIRTPVRRRLPTLAGQGRPGTVAITFDDGPDPRMTPALLEVLTDLGWPATFFMLGSQARAHPQLARAVVEAGHEIGLHGLSHRRLLRTGPMATAQDLRAGLEAMTDATGVRPHWFRPTYGELTGVALGCCLALGLRPVLWTSESKDWEPGDAESMRAHVCSSIGTGGTVLFHDAPQPSSGRTDAVDTAETLRRLADDFRSMGLDVVPLQKHLA